MKKTLKRNRHTSYPTRRSPFFSFDMVFTDAEKLFIQPKLMSPSQSFTLTIKNSRLCIFERETFSTDQEQIEVDLPSSLKGDIYITIETDDYIYTGTTTIL